MTSPHPEVKERGAPVRLVLLRVRFWLAISDILAPLYYRTRKGSWLGRPYLFVICRAAGAEFGDRNG